MVDLTIIMLTPNIVPKAWAQYHKKMLLEAAGDSEIITISREPLDWGVNLIQEDYGFTNIFRQMLRGAKLATTEFVAMADDDTLYPPQHFAWRPPPDDNRFYYNLNRWHLTTWHNPPFYFHKPRPGNGLLICRREAMVLGLTSRFRKHPELLPAHLSHELGIKHQALRHDRQEWAGFYTKVPVVSFYHEGSFDEASQRRRKYAWPVRALELPHWGSAYRLRRKFV